MRQLELHFRVNSEIQGLMICALGSRFFANAVTTSLSDSYAVILCKAHSDEEMREGYLAFKSELNKVGFADCQVFF